MSAFATEMMSRFRGNETVVAALARHMRRYGLTPDDVLAAYDEWMAERLAEMEPVGIVASDGLRVTSSAARNPRPAIRDPKRHKAGDHAQLPRACPRCEGAVEAYQMCPIESPVWRTQLACMADACAWHGKSRLSIDALIALGADRIKNYVSEG